MILVQSLFAVAVLWFAIRQNYIRDYRLISLLGLVFFAFSLFPSLSVPYIIDDVDHFYNMAGAIQTNTLTGWLMAAHNEHVIPLLKAIYLFCYTYFWLDPEIFHLIIIATCVGIVLLVYKLTFALTKSVPAALVGGAIMAATNVFDDTIFVITNAHILFSLFLFLLLFYAIHQYCAHQKVTWAATAFFAVIFLPATFALGLTSIVFAVLFVYLCLPQDLRRNGKKLFPALGIAWVLSFLPYALVMSSIVHAQHYKDLGARSIFEIADFLRPVPFLVEFVTVKLIPSILANPYLAFGIFFAALFTALGHTKKIPWKTVLFFALFGLFNNFIIYVFRSAWGPAYLDFPRYYVFPVAMIAFCYALLLDPFLKNKLQVKPMAAQQLIYLLCALIVIYGSIVRYNNGRLLAQETLVMQNFYVNFRKAFTGYFQEHPQTQTLQVKDLNIMLPSVSRLTPKKGYPPPIARYPLRPARFYAQYILPAQIYTKLIWADDAGPSFLEYLKSKEYFFLIG